jgi:hypothetical protein
VPGRPHNRRTAQRAGVFACLAVIFAIGACGEKSEPDVANLPPPPTTTTTGPSEPTTTAADGQTTTGTTTTPAPTGPRPATTVRDYVAALSAGNGRRVCDLFAPGALDEVRLPKPNRKCDVAIDRSIGYHDPKGPPAFESATVRRVKVRQRGARARVVATVITRYQSQRRPSTDDDIVYMKRSRAGWLILQPSATLYRAVGLEPPLSALKPPSGFLGF